MARWTGCALQTGAVFDVQAGGINVLGYQHHDIEDRSLLYVLLCYVRGAWLTGCGFLVGSIYMHCSLMPWRKAPGHQVYIRVQKE
jgi:hypothetical protein